MKKDQVEQKDVPEYTEYTEEAVAPKAVELSIDDLVAVINIINVATERGAFKAPELTPVGNVYDRISKFVKYIQDTEAKKANGGPTDGGQ